VDPTHRQSTGQLNQFLGHINHVHQNIKFNMELENHNKINFLDLTIERKDHCHHFKIFRKDMDTLIHNDSNSQNGSVPFHNP
jgi:hypothetical protein